MKLGVFTTLFSDRTLDETLAYLSSLGVEMIEIGCGGYPGNAHANPDILLNDKAQLEAFKETVAKYGMEISALSCHGNPVHPNKEIAAGYDKVIHDTILLAEKLGIHQINTFSGCPGDCENSKYPNWVTCIWPPDYEEILKYQWNEVLIPYWKETVAFAKAHGVDKIALELHPGFAVYNTDSLLKLREAVGPEIGANLDPSHLIWQGMDTVQVIKKLGDAIFHFHAKDTRVDEYNKAITGVLDTKPYGMVNERSWSFRTVGYASSENFWKDVISTLSLIGYDYAVSIEHEDALMTQTDGLEKAVKFLLPMMITKNTGSMWWA